jgi:sporulation protein YlmC with PRC-barrel domain
MRATELIGCDVYDVHGEHLGHVHDLRFESKGEPGSSTWRCVLTGVACGKTSVGHRFGYGTGDMAGPWPLNIIFVRRRRRSLEIDWNDIDELNRPTITLRVSRGDIEQSR